MHILTAKPPRGVYPAGCLNSRTLAQMPSLLEEQGPRPSPLGPPHSRGSPPHPHARTSAELKHCPGRGPTPSDPGSLGLGVAWTSRVFKAAQGIFINGRVGSSCSMAPRTSGRLVRDFQSHHRPGAVGDGREQRSSIWASSISNVVGDTRAPQSARRSK